MDLVSPYLTALAAARSHNKDDWSAVVNYANVLKEELESPLPGADIDALISNPDQFRQDISKLRGEASRLAEMGDKQVSTIEVMALIGEIQGKLREIIIDNVCACESGPKVLHYEVGKFPKQDKTLMMLRDLAGGYTIKQVHDDGDLTVEASDTVYVVTTDGKFFEQHVG